MFKTLFVICVIFGTVNLSDVSFYETLGISKHSTAREIRQAYKKLAIKYHPDKNEDESDQEKFLKITEAYETLKDPQKRRMYDTFGVHQQNSWNNDFHSQEEYDNMIHEGLYSKDLYVESLSAKEFYNYLSDGFHFINFYSPFCPPCQKLADHWKKLAKVYKGIVKVAAVNCKMHNSFCFNTMNIDGYPTLLFYSDGIQGSYIPYDGPRTFNHLEEFVLSYIGRKVSVPTLTYLESLDKPMAYVLYRYRIEPDALLRLAYRLKDLVTVAVIDDDTLRANLATQDRTTVVYKYGKTVKEIKSTDEKKILSKLVKALPAIESVDPDKFKQIRNDLRNGYPNAWVLYFSSKKENKLLLHQMKMKFPEMHFGEVNCSAWSQLCLSLQVEESPAWATLKPGGAYHKAPPSADLDTFLRNAPLATKLQSLEPSALETLHKDVGSWVVLVVPYKSSWDAIGEEFTRASLRFHDSKDISFGIVTCTEKTAFYCRDVSFKPVILMQTGDKRDTYTEDIDENEIVDFIHLVRDSAELELSEQQAMEITDPSREHTWLVAYLPHGSEHYKHEWRLIAKQLRPLQFVRVGVLQCARGAAGFCANVRAPTARLYPLASGQHHTVNLQNLKDAPLVLEWALEHIDDSVNKLNGNSFAKRVLVMELQPTSGTKPWLVYFHSPRCYSCYQRYPDFAIAGILLNNAVNLGKVNCLNDRGVCQQEQIERYPSLRLYLNRNHRQSFSSVIPIQIEDYKTILENVKSHLMKYDESLLAGTSDKTDSGALSQPSPSLQDEDLPESAMPMASKSNEKASPPDHEPNPAPPVAPVATKRQSLAPSALMQTLRKDEADCSASQPCPSLQVEDMPEWAMPDLKPIKANQKSSPPDLKPSDANQKATPPDLKPSDANQKATPPYLKPSDANQKATPPDLKPSDANQMATPPDLKPSDANQKASPPDLKPSDANQKATPPNLKPSDANQKASPPDLKPSDANQKATPPDLKPSDANQKATPPDLKPSDANQMTTPPDLKLSDANQKASPPDFKPSDTNQKATPPDFKPSDVNQKATPPDFKPSDVNQKATPPDFKPSDVNQKATPPDFKLSDANQKASPPDFKPSDTNQKATPPDFKPSDVNQKATPPDFKPSDANQKASSPDIKPGDANQKLSTPDLKPIHDLPIASKLHSSAPNALLQTLHKGDIRCRASKPCPSLQVDDRPPWAMLKPRRGHQKASQSADLSTLPAMPIAPLATKLHVLASSALQTLQKDVGSWVVLVVPYKSAWDEISETFMHASQYFLNSEVVSFGIVTCTEKSASYCHEVPSYSAVILMQTGNKRDVYSEHVDENEIVDFVQQIQNSADLELTEGQVLDLKDPNRDQMWLVACLPPGHEDMKQEWLLVANKLRPLQAVRVGVLQHSRAGAGFCAGVDAPTARFYPLASGQHSGTFDLQALKEAPFVLEWALENIDDSVKKLNWSSFAKRILTLEMEPSSVFRPWLIYFHSPWCYNCYQNYPDFAIAGIRLNKYVNLGKVNCYEELDICQHEQVETYPTLRLYYNRDTLTSIPIQDLDFSATIKLVKTHLEDFYGGFFDL